MIKKWMKKALIVMTTAALLTGCAAGSTGSEQAAGSASDSDAYPKGTVDFVCPGGAGGGWDLTIRTTAKVLQDAGLVDAAMPVTNKPGGGGGVTLSYLQTKDGADDTISVFSTAASDQLEWFDRVQLQRYDTTIKTDCRLRCICCC